MYVPAGEPLTCTILMHNTGNVGLKTLLMTSPSTCSAGELLPFGPPANCTITVTATQHDFERGYINLTAAGVAAPRPLTGPASITWESHAIVQLIRMGRMNVHPSVPSGTVLSAGVYLLSADCRLQDSEATGGTGYILQSVADNLSCQAACTPVDMLTDTCQHVAAWSCIAGADVTVLYTLENIGNVRLFNTTVWSSVAGNMTCITQSSGMRSSVLEVDVPLLCRCVGYLYMSCVMLINMCV